MYRNFCVFELVMEVIIVMSDFFIFKVDHIQVSNINPIILQTCKNLHISLNFYFTISLLFIIVLTLSCGPGSSVGIATELRAGRSGIELCNTLYHISRGETGIQGMRITKVWPTTDWNTVWKNIHCTSVPGGTKAAWYMVIHDILPTSDRLYKIRMSPPGKRSNCGMHDTLQHRLIECGEGPQIWQWTTQKLALILRTIPTRIPSDWLLRPQCVLWPPTRRRAGMWILANLVLFRTRPNQELTLRDFIELMQGNKYKLYQTVKRRLLVANYLLVLDMP